MASAFRANQLNHIDEKRMTKSIKQGLIMMSLFLIIKHKIVSLV